MSVFGVSLFDLLLLTFCFSVPFAVLALIVTVLYRRDRRLTPPEAANIAGDVYPKYPGRSVRYPSPVRPPIAPGPDGPDPEPSSGDDGETGRTS